jgi:hypothetical protein
VDENISAAESDDSINVTGDNRETEHKNSVSDCETVCTSGSRTQKNQQTTIMKHKNNSNTTTEYHSAEHFSTSTTKF